MNRFHVFLGLESVSFEGECFDSSQDITDICCLADHVFILLKNQAVYHGLFQEIDNVPRITMLNKLSLDAANIASNSNTFFITTKNGQVFKCSGENFDVFEEVIVKEDSKCCIHGYQTVGHNIKVKAVAAGENGCLYVTDNGQLWASGDYVQLGLHCDEPKRVTFFDNRFVESVACGADFSLAVVHKSRQPTHDKDDTDTEVGDDNEVFVSSCPICISESLLTPLSQHSLTPERCPLGLPVQNSSEEHYSSSTASKDNSADDKRSTDESTSVSMRDETILKVKGQLRPTQDDPQICMPLEENHKKICQSNCDVTASDLVTESDSDETAEKKNEFFINTEAARQFLTRQLSWVSSYGGASEELLAECAEASIVRPTRLLKQNVSNMASLVYEGVKNVGDRVVTLSRHMSGGSEETNDMSTEKLGESFEELNCDMIPAGSIASSLSRCDDFPCSSSADTSDQADKSELGLTGKASAMAQVGAGFLSTELWSWGSISHGQLGLGDTIKRHRPSLVSRLSGLGVCQIACGQSHVLALTLDGRVFAWGANNVHQVTFDTLVDQSGPVQITGLVNGERMCGIAAGTRHSIITSHKGNVYYLGKHSNGPVPGMGTINVPSLSENISQKCVFASGNISICQVRDIKMPSAIKDLTTEQLFLEETLLVQNALIKQLHKQDTITTSLSEDISVYEKLCSCYNEVVNITALNVKALQTFTEQGGDGGTIPFFHNVSEHIQVYWNYLDAVCNVIAISGFAHIAQSVDVSQKLFSICPDIPPKKNKKSMETIISHALLHPLSRLNIYKCMIVSLFHCHSNKQHILDGKSQTDNKFNDSRSKWEHLWEEQERRRKEADATRLFWEGSGRLVELLRCPTRRLIRESKTHPITLFNSGRFSSHWLVLLSDVLVHVSGNSHTTHPLTTVWVEPLQDTETQQNALLLTMPEDSLTLCCPTPQQKAEWLHALQTAINRRLHKSASHPPAVVRTATYQFLKHPTFKDATYTGRWSSGKLHGVGKLEWPDGRLYVGKFHMNQQNGFGRMEVPSVSICEGQWKDGQQNGYGVMKYANGDIYEGYFKDGVPHGHGVHKQGHFTASVASVYIGEWVNGVKQGYGVMDDIITGEKYLGSWNNNLKHGSGLIVTLDGIYYEGHFFQDILTGYGVMVFEDGTHYEGELKGIGCFSGKGMLTFLSGDSIEGTLYGNWNEGVKITGTFHKNQATPPTQLISNPNSFGKLCVSPDKKWKAIFRQCYLQLGLTEMNGKSIVPDTQKIWDNVAVLISNSYQETSQRPRGIANKEFISMDKLDTIPQFGRVLLDKESYQELRNYLFKAFESNHHPLGKLLAEVSSAYTATYGGVRVHPLLLSHAVSELHSLTSRVYEVVQLLFPALPAVGEEILLPSGNAGEQDSETVSSAALLHPVLLPRVHSALFVLYALHNKREDDAYWKRLLKWNKQPDITLLAFLGIDQKFWFNYTSQNQSPRNGESTFSPCQQRLFTEAVETLQQLKTTFSPMEKLLVIRNTFQQMTHVVQQQLGNTYLWTMDDLFPVFHFVVIRSQILQLGSEIHFVEDFMEPHLQNGELGIMFTTLKACYYQILQEKSSMSL